MVAGYPSESMAQSIAEALVEGGTSYLEIQLPFSDPSADGPAIQEASSRVLERGYALKDGLSFVDFLTTSFPGIPVFVMTYANLAYRRGIARFTSEAAAAGASGLIIPDLPFDCDEGLNHACVEHGIHAVPVAAPSMSDQRRNKLVELGRPYVYAPLRAGITGSSTIIDEDTITFLNQLRGTSRILGGFGIRTGEQSRLLSDHVHAVVAGSVFVELIGEYAKDGTATLKQVIRDKAAELSGVAWESV
jgi:tryptophan synthase alpha chain